MLLIDGVKYEEWTPSGAHAEDDFEQEAGKHAEEIFGKDAQYFDLKHKLASKSGTGSIPDGYVITLGNKPEVQIIEFELESHSLQHIVSQMVNIINGIENSTTQQKICNAIEDGIHENDLFEAQIVKAIKPVSIHRFLSDCFSNTLPKINIIIDQSWPALEEAISKITPPPKIIEFRTFTREQTGLAVHAHLFEPLYRFPIEIGPSIGYVQEKTDEPDQRMVVAGHKAAETRRRNLEVLVAAGASTKRITIQNLIDARILRIGQTLWGQRGDSRYEGKIIDGGKILLSGNPMPFDTPSGAAVSAKGTSEDGWRWWHTKGEDGREYALDELRRKYARNPSP